MEKSSIIVLSVIAIISFCYAFSVYVYIANALDSNMRKFSEGYSEGLASSSLGPPVQGEDLLNTLKSLCTIEVTSNISMENSTRYYYGAKNCDISKINSFGNSVKSYDEAIMYLSLTTSLAVQDMAKDRVSVIHERYPNENLLLVEKIHDVLGMLMPIADSGLSWAQITGMFPKCQAEEGANKTTDMNCIKSILEAEGKSTPVIMSRIDLQGFKEKCQVYYSKNNVSMSTMSLINTNDACLRTEEIYKDLYEKSASGSSEDTVNGKFFKALVFYYLSNIDKDPQDVAKDINVILKENIAPEYRDKF